MLIPENTKTQYQAQEQNQLSLNFRTISNLNAVCLITLQPKRKSTPSVFLRKPHHSDQLKTTQTSLFHAKHLSSTLASKIRYIKTCFNGISA